MARQDITEFTRQALYDAIRLQFVAFVRGAVDFANMANTGLGSDIQLACVGALLGDYVLAGSEDAIEATTPVTFYVSAADSIRFCAINGQAGANNPASHTFRATVLRAM